MIAFHVRLQCRAFARVVILALLSAPPAALAGQPACTTTPLTNTIGMQGNVGLTLDDLATRAAFSSNGNYTGQNIDFSFEAFALTLPGGPLEQLTNDGSLASTSNTLLSADGERLFFISSTDPTGGNPDRNFEVYVYDFAGAVFTQLTDTVGINSMNSLARDAAANRLAFNSSFNPLGTNPDGNQEIFLIEVATQTLTQATVSSGGFNSSPSLSGNGNLLAVASDLNYTGMNPDGTNEIFLFDLGAATVTQVTPTGTDNSGFPLLSTAGDFLVFVSDGNFDGSNPEGNQELFHFDLGTMTITALTSAPFGAMISPHLSTDGSHVTFASNANYTGQNPDVSFEIFLLEFGGTLTQISGSTVGSIASAIDGDGSSVLFSADNNVFLYDCPVPGEEIEEIPTLGGWGLLGFALLLGSAALTLRRKMRA